MKYFICFLLAVASVEAQSTPPESFVKYTDGRPDASSSGGITQNPPLPLLGLANVTVDVSDLDRARSFYTRVTGLEEAFDTKDVDGKVTAAYFKVNDKQFVEVKPGRANWQSIRHFAFRSDNIEQLRAMLVARGLEPGEISPRPDGNQSFSLGKLPGQQLGGMEFIQYVPGSLSERTAGQFLGKERLSDHLEHVGIIATDFDAAYTFFKSVLGFQDRYMRLNFERTRVILDQLCIPGPKMEFVELFNETGAPLPVTHAVAKGAVHFALTVPDDMATFKMISDRGVAGNRALPRFAWDNRYNTNVFDPDGTRVEFMQPEDPQRPTPLVVYTPKPPAK